MFANSPHGTYWFPPNDDGEHKIEILTTLTPQREWFDILAFEEETVTQDCDQEPPSTEDTYIADWRLEWHDILFDGDSPGCRASFVVDDREIVAVEIESPAGCYTVERPEPSSGTLSATLTTGWAAAERQEQGYWTLGLEEPGGIETLRVKRCKMSHELAGVSRLYWPNESILWRYRCVTQDPWPPELETVCPPVTPNALQDLSAMPPTKICSDIEVGEFVEFERPPSDTGTDWRACYVPATMHQRCTLEGGGAYPVTLTVDGYLTWHKVITDCQQEYTKQELFVVEPDGTTLPESLGILDVEERAGEPLTG